MADYSSGLQIIDVSNAAELHRVLGVTTHQVRAYGVSLSSDGRFAYVAA